LHTYIEGVQKSSINLLMDARILHYKYDRD
jgi:hypothetical protein